ncbi:MAG: signal peptidase II [Microbacteriaceae bacterium]
MAEPTNTATTAGTPKVSYKALAILAVVAVFVYILDQVSKFLVVSNLTEGVSVEIFGEFLRFTFVRNPGAAFSIGTGSTWIFAILATAVAIFILFFARRIRALSWAALFGLLLGGNVGNLTDRLTREPGFGIGHVIDFIQVYAFPAIFNVADIAIVSSMGLFIILTLRGVGLDGTRTVREKKPAAVETDAAASGQDK